jgi:pyruvate ferredoxin oxidoreductase beta subunit/2-oxoisovalerate ferredoxin oxidoreductase beta subunit
MVYVCYDNEAYMNTGVQRSSSTPLGAWTTTTPFQAPEDRPKKRIAAIVAAHEIPYMATASISYPQDLEQKVRKAKSIKGFCFIHILIPCPTGWLYATKDSVKLGRLAVLSRIFPLYEVFGGKQYRLTPMDEKVPVHGYVTSQGRFKGLSEGAIQGIQENVDQDWTELEELAARSKELRS